MAKIEDAFFVEDSSFKKMMNIINEYKLNPPLIAESERHHIIPKSFFRKQGLKVDGSKGNLVRLPFYEHMLVHFYAAQCAKPIIKDAMICAANNFFKIKNLNEDWVLKHKKEIVEIRNKSQILNRKAWLEWNKKNKPEDVERYYKNLAEKNKKKLHKFYFPGLKIKDINSADIRKCVDSLNSSADVVTREKNDIVVRGKKIKKVVCVDTGEVFNSVKEVAEKENCILQNVYRVLSGKSRHSTLHGKTYIYLDNWDGKTKNTVASNKAKKIYCYENKKSYLSIKECARELGLKDSRIANVCKGVSSQTKGYHFCFEENKKNYIPKKRTNSLRGKATGKGRKVYCLENKKTYLSARDVCYQFGWDVKKYNSSIYQCCKGKMKQCKGYHFVWEDEYASWKTATTARIKRV